MLQQASSQVQAVGAGRPAIQLLQRPGVAAPVLAVEDKRLEGSHLAAGGTAEAPPTGWTWPCKACTCTKASMVVCV
jgi:hypothetical protein